MIESIQFGSKKIEFQLEFSKRKLGIFQMTIKVVDKYTKYFVKGDTTPVKINFFKENLQ